MYPTVVAQCPQYASKITGMLLEMEVSDLLYLLGYGDELDRKINEAFQVLIEHLNNAYRNPRAGEPLLS
jgi:polyadenylate-binding protein